LAGLIFGDPMLLQPLRPTGRLPLVAAFLIAGVWHAAPRVIHVIASDYSLTGPESVRPGATTFTLENRGAKFHEMFIGLLRPGAGAAEIVAAHKQGVGFRLLSQFYLDGDADAALMAAPGKTSAARITVDLLRGRSYVLFCQLRDSVGALQHAALGMFRILRVE
jgi:hypothetical protein